MEVVGKPSLRQLSLILHIGCLPSPPTTSFCQQNELFSAELARIDYSIDIVQRQRALRARYPLRSAAKGSELTKEQFICPVATDLNSSPVSTLLDALDRRINANSLLLAVLVEQKCHTQLDMAQTIDAWINGPAFQPSYIEAWALRGVKVSETYITARTIPLTTTTMTPEAFVHRLWWLLQESHSYYNQALSPHKAHRLITNFLMEIFEGEVSQYSRYPQLPCIELSTASPWYFFDIPTASLQPKLPQYFDGFQQDTTTIWGRDSLLFMLLTNGCP